MDRSFRTRLRGILLLATVGLVIAAAFGVSTLLVPSTAVAAQSIPYKINFQGRLTDNNGNILTDGLYNIKFRLFDAATAGTNVWEGDRVRGTSDNRIQITNGLFNIQFGDTALGDPALSPALFAGTFPLYLEVELPTPATATCATNGCAVFTEGAMTPRQPLASSAYAFNADTVDGIDAASLVQLSPSGAQTGNININGTIASSGTVNGATLTGGSLSATSVNSLNVSAGAIAVAAAATNLTVDAGTTGTIAVGGTSTGDILLGGGAASTGCTVTNTTGDLACTGTITGTTLNGTTGINTGSAGGTQRIDTSGNLVNIANITQSGQYLLQNTSNSTSAFNILTAGGSPRTVVNVDTVNTEVNLDANLIVNSSIAVPSITSVTFSSNSTGSLSGAPGTNYFYRIAAIVGTETAASGETWISSSSFTPLSPPSAPTAAAGASGGITGTYTYKYTFVTANGETTPSTASGSVTVSNKKINVTIATGPTGTTARKIYRTTNGGSTYLLLTTVADNVTTAYVDSTADAGLGVAAPGSNTATTNLNSVSITFPSFPGATSYEIYRGLASRAEDHYQTATSSPFIDTGAVGTAATPIEPTAGRIGVGTTSPGFALDVAGNISASNAFVQNGNVGQTVSCGAGNAFSGMTVSGGIVTATGACASIGGGSASATLQSAYDNSSIPQISLSSAGGALTVSDTAAGLGTNLLAVENNAGTTTYLGVSATGIAVVGSGTFTAGVSISTGQTYQINGTQITTAALSDASSITMQGNAFNGASQLVQTTVGGALPALSGTNLTSLNPSNLATGSGAVAVASGTGTGLTLNAANGTLILGSSTTTLQHAASTLTIDLATAATSTLTITNSDATNIANLAVEGGLTIGSGKAVTVGSTPGVDRACIAGQILDAINTLGGIVTSGTCTTPTAGGGANTTLSNLGATAINADLVPDATANNRNIGSLSVLWNNGYYGNSVQSPLFTGAGAVALKSATTNNLTIDSGTTGSILIGGDTVNAKTISLGATATNTNTTILNLGINTAGTQNVNLGSAGTGDAAAGTAINIQGGTTANTAVTLGTNGAGGITIDTGTTGSIFIGTGASAKSSTLGSTATTSTTNILGGTTGAINIGSIGASTLSSTTNIATSTNATGTQTVTIGSNANVANAVTIDAGNTGAISIGDSTSAHTINIATAGAAGGNAQIVTIGSPTTTTASLVTLQGGNITTTNGNAGIVIGGGYSASDTNLVALTLDSSSTFAETANTCSATVNGGSLYYNSTSNSVRACINGNWEDMVSTAELGLQLFGVVPDSGTNPGDVAAVSGLQNGPCKVSVGATNTTVSWKSCIAFSGGRKVNVTAGTATVTTNNNQFQHLCLTGANGQPALSAAGSEVANLATVSLATVGSPTLCLADIKTSASAITVIYDTRTYTTTAKEYATVTTTAPALGHLVQYIATRGTMQPIATLNGNNLAGVVVASTGATSTTTNNVIIAISGQAAVKAITGTNLVGAYIFGSATAGYAITVATKPTETTATIYNVLGSARTPWTGATTCVVNSDACAGSILTDIDKR